MNRFRFSLTTVLVFGLCACAPSSAGDDKSGESTPSVPPGFELAAAKTATADRRGNDAGIPRDFTNDRSQVVDLSVEELAALSASDDIWLIDVRTDEEVANGMVAGATHIPLAAFSPGPDLIDQAKGREIVLYCRSGRRSAIAAKNLSGYLGEPVKHLTGGFNAWKEADRDTQ
ncbi:rhodanese-like domain-containing protein [Erythrobacter insulae]|uniref:Rhodanese-like domain-containing protein n=1 Tax=Erythrobacter insulae TaxID=2584124 RepID=A0A547PC71_9SPHN|nr:rhodanese-like domain-containing protein [Erythrobacter insulae]TRD11743.1 rhodanese-like domain-containing protein [Erythrobacter insulae]